MNVYEQYNKIAQWFAENRYKELLEKPYLDAVIKHLPKRAKVLDLGCGTGEPILAYLIQEGVDVLGVDASVAMLNLARINFPETEFILQDMRKLSLPVKYNAIIAWHSFFHLPAADQPAMIGVFEKHLEPNGILLFTSGSEHGEAWGLNGGENLFHASLDTSEYRKLLEAHHFEVLLHVIEDPDCGNATIWMAKYNPE